MEKKRIQRPILLSNKTPEEVCDVIDGIVSEGNRIDSVTELARVDIEGKTRNTVLLIISIEVYIDVEQPIKKQDGKRESVSGNGS